MYFSIQSNELKRATGLIRPLIQVKTTLPILGHVLIQHPEPGKVCFSATDLDQHLRVFCPVTDVKPSSAIIPFALLRRAAQEADKDTPIRFELVEGKIELQWVSKGKAWQESDDALPSKEFPAAPNTAGWKGQWLPKSLVETIGAATAFASTDEMRYVLNGVCLDAESHHVVATDGRRLIAARSAVALNHSAIIPTKVAQYLGTHLEEGPAWFKVVEEGKGDQKRISVTHGMAQLPGGALYLFKCPDGNYPNWRQVVPGAKEMKCRAKFTLGQKELAELFRKHLSRGADKTLFKLERGQFSICFIRADRPPTKWELAGIESGGGEARQACFAASFIHDMLRHVGPEFRFIDEISPLVFEGECQRVGAVMPMRLAQPAPKSRVVQCMPETAPPADQTRRKRTQTTAGRQVRGKA
jgi:DNA polymerase III sliding clamp (beta) subunit (PCNA family)